MPSSKELQIRLAIYYASQLSIIYKTKPKAFATMAWFTGANMANGIFFYFLENYNLDTAQGVQLDVLGQIRGVNRQAVGSFIPGIYFGFDTQIGVRGFGALYDSELGAPFIRLSDIKRQKIDLPDPAFRALIKARIVTIFSNNTTEDLNRLMYFYFGNFVWYTDNYDMTMTLNILTTINPVVRAIFEYLVMFNLIPKPAGVRLILNEVMA